jgi:hypothetical protein
MEFSGMKPFEAFRNIRQHRHCSAPYLIAQAVIPGELPRIADRINLPNKFPSFLSGNQVLKPLNLPHPPPKQLSTQPYLFAFHSSLSTQHSALFFTHRS